MALWRSRFPVPCEPCTADTLSSVSLLLYLRLLPIQSFTSTNTRHCQIAAALWLIHGTTGLRLRSHPTGGSNEAPWSTGSLHVHKSLPRAIGNPPLIASGIHKRVRTTRLGTLCPHGRVRRGRVSASCPRSTRISSAPHGRNERWSGTPGHLKARQLAHAERPNPLRLPLRAKRCGRLRLAAGIS